MLEELDKNELIQMIQSLEKENRELKRLLYEFISNGKGKSRREINEYIILY